MAQYATVKEFTQYSPNYVHIYLSKPNTNDTLIWKSLIEYKTNVINIMPLMKENKTWQFWNIFLFCCCFYMYLIRSKKYIGSRKGNFEGMAPTIIQLRIYCLWRQCFCDKIFVIGIFISPLLWNTERTSMRFNWIMPAICVVFLTSLVLRTIYKQFNFLQNEHHT